MKPFFKSFFSFSVYDVVINKTVSIFHKQSPSNRKDLRTASGGLFCLNRIKLNRIKNTASEDFDAVFLLYRKLRFHKAKILYVPPNARFTCSEMDKSKTVAVGIRRSRFLVDLNISNDIRMLFLSTLTICISEFV